MKALHRKLFRDLGHIRGQLLAVSVIMGCGLALMIMSRSLIRSLESARDRYYEENRFADVFCELKRAPNIVRSRLERVEGVSAVETRVVGRVTLELPGQNATAQGMIHSLPEDRPQRLNLLYLRRGRLPAWGGRSEVVVGEAFAKAHGFEPGDSLSVILHGVRQRLTIVGIVLSPEYVFEARPGETLPDARRFGVFWMNERELAAALQLRGAFNQVLVDVAPGVGVEGVLSELDQILTPYGGLKAYGRKDHPSATRVNDELRVMRGISFVFPTIFLGIAALMTSAMVSRLVRMQREQIAQLKAFGYGSLEVGLHYLGFAGVVVVFGGVLGCFGGSGLGAKVVVLYRRFFQFPALDFRADYGVISLALVLSCMAAGLSVVGTVWRVVRLAPAEAMRPEPPAEFRKSWLERLGLSRWMGSELRMVARNLERKPLQSIFTATGLMLATAIPVVPGAMRDGIDFLLNFQWDLSQRQDVSVGLVDPASATATHALQHLPGVLRVEPFRRVAARIRYGVHSRRLGVTGVSEEAELGRLLDGRGRPVAIAREGLMVSAKLAEVFGMVPGDWVELEIQEGKRPRRWVELAGVITDYAGLSAYMEMGALHRLMGEGGTISGAHLTVDGSQWEAFWERVRGAPRVASAIVKEAVRASFRRSTGEMVGTIQAIYFAFATLVAFGVVYNSSRIALSERSRELATLRVMGFTHREVLRLFVGELAVLTGVALPFGLALGSYFAGLIVSTASTETVRIPLELTARNYATAVLIVVVSAAFSSAVVAFRLRHLDLLGVLKSSE
jgi:putative ABC transport system permease protein